MKTLSIILILIIGSLAVFVSLVNVVVVWTLVLLD